MMNDTEHRIECAVERMTDRADAAYMAGRMTEEEYRAEMKRINDWAESEYDKA